MKVYRILLRLYPQDYRLVFAAEMLTVFESMSEDRRRQGKAIFLRFLLAEWLSVLREAEKEWSAKLAADLYREANLVRPLSFLADGVAKLIYAVYHANHSFRSRCVPDLRMLRPAGVSWEAFYGSRTAQLNNRF